MLNIWKEYSSGDAWYSKKKSQTREGDHSPLTHIPGSTTLFCGACVSVCVFVLSSALHQPSIPLMTAGKQRAEIRRQDVTVRAKKRKQKKNNKNKDSNEPKQLQSCSHQYTQTVEDGVLFSVSRERERALEGAGPAAGALAPTALEPGNRMKTGGTRWCLLV